MLTLYEGRSGELSATGHRHKAPEPRENAMTHEKFRGNKTVDRSAKCEYSRHGKERQLKTDVIEAERTDDKYRQSRDGKDIEGRAVMLQRHGKRESADHDGGTHDGDGHADKKDIGPNENDNQYFAKKGETTAEKDGCQKKIDYAEVHP